MKNILLVKISAMGDVVHTFPVVRAIKAKWPGARIDWVVGEAYIPLVNLSPYVTNVIPFRRKEWGRWWKVSTIRELAGFAANVRREKYDAVIDLQGLLRSGLVTAAARADMKIGFDYAREGAARFYNVKIKSIGENAHAIERYMSALEPLGLTGADIGYDIAPPQDAMQWAETVAPKEPFAVVNPNARWDTKRWPEEKFASLIKELHDKYGLLSVITGGGEDVERGRAISQMAGDCAIDLTAKGGFGELAAILKKATVMFTNDSGPMHLSVAVGTPVVAIFGPTNPHRTGPYGTGNAIVTSGADCAPCYKRTCAGAMECMKNIAVMEVTDAWAKLRKEIP